MIKINLLKRKKKFKAVVLGVDLSQANFRGILIAIIISLLPGIILYGQWENNTKELQQDINKLKGEIRKLQVESNKLKNIQDEIDAFAKQEVKLQDKLKVVKQIIKIKKNPVNILLYIAKHIPKDIWLTDLNVNNDKLVLKGRSVSYKSIGLFIKNLKSSVFFDKSLDLVSSKTISEKELGVRTEEFEISSTIARYDL